MARTGGEAAPKLRSKSAVAAKDAKAKDAKAKDAGTKVAAVAAPDGAAPLAAELRKPASDDSAIAAVKKLSELGTPHAIDILLGELAIGMSPRVAKAALDVLATRKADPAAGPMPNTFSVLSLYVHHRNPELRKQALAAMAALPTATATATATGVVATPAPAVAAPAPGKAAAAANKTAPVAKAPEAAPVPAGQSEQIVSLLIAALSDPNSDVRAVAAESLGKRHETRAEPALIKLLLRKDGAAPPALGQIGGPDTARALAEMIGNVPDSMILETLGHLLERPDFGPEPVRVQVVKTVGKMPGSQTLDILGDYVKDTAKDKQRPSRIEAQKIIEQRTAK